MGDADGCRMRDNRRRATSEGRECRPLACASAAPNGTATAALRSAQRARRGREQSDNIINDYYYFLFVLYSFKYCDVGFLYCFSVLLNIVAGFGVET